MLKHPVKLGQYIFEVRMPVGSIDGDNLPVYGVTNIDGITITGKESSKNLSKYFRLKPKHFAYNPYRINVGSIGLADESQDGIVSPAYVVFATKSELAPHYLFKYLKSHKGHNQINFYGNRGSVRQSLRFNDLCKIEIPLPPLLEQHRIAAKIEELTAKIQEAKGLRKEAKEKVKSLLFAKLNEIFSTSTKNNLQIMKLADICDTTSGGTPSRHRFDFFANGSVPWIKSGELKDTFIKESEEYITQEAMDSSNAKIFPKGTLLVALYGANVGMTGILDIDAATNQAVCAVFPKKELLKRDYLYWFFRKMRPDYLKNSFGGAQPNISQKMIRETKILIPSLSDQRRIVDYLNKLQSQAGELCKYQTETQEQIDVLSQAILAKAFKGEL